MATLTRACGFECGVAGGSNDTVHVVSIDGGAFNTSTVRNGDRSMRVNAVASIATVRMDGGAKPQDPGSNVNVIRVAVRFASLPTAVTCIVWPDNATVAGAYFNSVDSKIYAGSSAINLGATGVSVTTNTWYIIDVKVISSANPWTIDVQVDGTACGQATVAVASATMTDILIGASLAVTVDEYFDDFAVSYTSGDYPLGTGYVHHFVPTSDGTHNVAGANDFERGTTGTDIIVGTTTAYQLVDEIPLDSGTPDTDDYINCIAPPNSTDYVEVKYGPAPSIITPTSGPRAVDVLWAHHEAGTGLGVSAAKLNDNGTIADVENQGSQAGSTALSYYHKTFATAPSTSAAWTAALFNNLRLRFGYSSDANPDQYFDCTMIEAEFAGSPPVATRRRQHVIEEE